MCYFSSKSDDFSRRYGVLTIFKMAEVLHLQFLKFAVYVMLSVLLLHATFELWPKTNFQYGGRPPSLICRDVTIASKNTLS